MDVLILLNVVVNTYDVHKDVPYNQSFHRCGLLGSTVGSLGSIVKGLCVSKHR